MVKASNRNLRIVRSRPAQSWDMRVRRAQGECAVRTDGTRTIPTVTPFREITFHMVSGVGCKNLCAMLCVVWQKSRGTPSGSCDMTRRRTAHQAVEIPFEL